MVVAELLHIVVQVNQLHCAVPEGDTLAEGNQHVLVLVPQEARPEDYSQRLLRSRIEILVEEEGLTEAGICGFEVIREDRRDEVWEVMRNTIDIICLFAVIEQL